MTVKYSSTAKVIDGVLILSLPDAVTPVVWQMELGQSKSSALEIRTTSDNQFLLVLKTPRADALDIATYANRAQAIKALLVVSQAMEKAQGQLKAAAAPHSYPVPVVTAREPVAAINFIKKLLRFSAMIIVAIILCAVLLFGVGKLFLGSSSPQTSATSNSPISADEFLESR